MRENLGLLIQKRARISRNHEALVEVERERRYTYGELNARVNRAAGALRELGVRAGDRVALLLMNGVEFIEAYFGAAKIGAVVVPLNWRLVADELDFILGDCGATLLVHDAEFAETVEALRARDLPVRHWIATSGGRRLGLLAGSLRVGQRCRSRDRRRGRRRALHHVHVGDDGPPQGRRAHAPIGPLGQPDDPDHGGHPRERPLPAGPAALPRGSAHAPDRVAAPGRQRRDDARLRSRKDLLAGRERAHLEHVRGSRDAAVHVDGAGS